MGVKGRVAQDMRFNRIATVVASLAVVTVFAVRASAADSVPDPNTQREFGAKLQVCSVCHGANGVPKSPEIPIIWGQQESYLQKEVHDFRTADRAAEVMNWMSRALEQDEVAPTGSWFATKSWPARAQRAAAATPPPGINVCQSCHQANFMGAAQAEGTPTPRLAGQNYEYLVEAMRRFADGERTNNSDMVQIMKAISPANREAMARYLSGL